MRQLAEKQITEDQALEKIAVIQRALARDRGFGPGESIAERAGSIKHIENASFQVKYKHQGNIDRERSYSFVRFNARMLGISRVPDTSRSGKNWLIKVFGDRPNKELIATLEEAGLKANGRFRIQTDAKVLKHNADKQYRTGPLIVYEWNISSLKKAPPNLSFALQP